MYHQSFISESQSAFVASTPVRASQDSFTNSPVDCKVPTTPSIACLKRVSDQRVPLTPTTQVVHVSPANSVSVPSTPENSIKTTPKIIEATRCCDNSNENFQDGASTVDQIVPFTPEGHFRASSRQGKCYGQFSPSQNITVLHKNIGSCIGDPYSFENSVSPPIVAAEYPRRSAQKRLSLTKRGINFDDSTSTHQDLKDIWTSQIPMPNAFGNETLNLSISEYSLQTSHGISEAQPESIVSPPAYLNLLPQSGTETSEPSLTSTTSSVLNSFAVTSNARTEASTSMTYLSAGTSYNHTRDEVTKLRQPFSQIKESHCFQVGNQNNQFHVSEQLKLFDGDDIFA